MMTVFANNSSLNGLGSQNRLWVEDELPGYRRLSIQFVRLRCDTVIYAQFVRRSGANDDSSDTDNPDDDVDDDESNRSV